MKVFVKSLTGKGMYVEVDPDITIKSLKEKSGEAFIFANKPIAFSCWRHCKFWMVKRHFSVLRFASCLRQQWISNWRRYTAFQTNEQISWFSCFSLVIRLVTTRQSLSSFERKRKNSTWLNWTFPLPAIKPHASCSPLKFAPVSHQITNGSALRITHAKGTIWNALRIIPGLKNSTSCLRRQWVWHWVGEIGIYCSSISSLCKHSRLIILVLNLELFSLKLGETPH